MLSGQNEQLLSSPLITTVIPTYRRPRTLARAIRSVLAQTYPRFRVCIYDDASGDETASVVEEFAKNDGRVRFHCRSERIGLCRNFADAAERVDTPFFSFLSDDDLLLPEFYETALAGFAKFPEAMMSATASIRITDRGKVTQVPILNWRPGLYQPPDGMVCMVKNGHPDWTGVLFRQSLLQKIGPLDIDVGWPFDVDFELRAAARFPMAVSLQPGALFVIHNGSTGLLGGFEALSSGFYRIICKIEADDTIPQEARTDAAQLLIGQIRTMLLRSAISLIARGDWSKADEAISYLQSHCRLATEPFLLNLLSKACQRVELLRRALSGLLVPYRGIAGSPKSFKPDKQLQRRFGAYASCL